MSRCSVMYAISMRMIAGFRLDELKEACIDEFSENGWNHIYEMYQYRRVNDRRYSKKGISQNLEGVEPGL